MRKRRTVAAVAVARQLVPGAVYAWSAFPGVARGDAPALGVTGTIMLASAVLPIFVRPPEPGC